jgi:hypothetical protein
MGSPRRPELGDRVKVERVFHDDTKEGVVVELMSTQFTYLDDEENIHYCFYKNDWTPVKEDV